MVAYLSAVLSVNSDDNENRKDIIALIEIAKKTPKVPFKKDKSELDEVKQFILDNNLKSHGTATVPASVIYARYFQWSRHNSKKPKNPVYFFTRFKLHFNQRIMGNKTYYLLHPEGFDLSIENISLANDEYKKSRKKKSKI